jgi:ribose 5-phosphate isomerase B
MTQLMPKKFSTAPSRRHWSTISERASDEPLTGTRQRVGVAADHGGFELKEQLVGKLRKAGHAVIDFGDRQAKLGDDYPDFVVPLARAVAAGTVDRGVAICGSGVGASVCANKVVGVRACLIHETFSAHQGVEDDDINVICLGGLVVGHALAWELVQTFLAARFSGAERHRRRLAKVADLENKL